MSKLKDFLAMQLDIIKLTKSIAPRAWLFSIILNIILTLTFPTVMLPLYIVWYTAAYFLIPHSMYAPTTKTKRLN